MYKTGYNLSDGEIQKRYSQITELISMPSYFYPHVADLVASRCAGDRMLDIGCGNGFLLEQVAARRPDLQLCGFDVSPALIRNTQTRAAGRWHVLAASGRYIPFAPGSFDMVTMTEVVEHVKEPVAVLRAAAALLKPNGSLLLTMPNMTGYSPFWRFAEHVPFESVQRTLLPSEHPQNTLQPIDTAYVFGEIMSLLDEAGLAVERMHGREFFPYTISSVQVPRRADDDPLGARRPTVLRTLIEAHKRADSLLGAVLPAQIGYRLFVECRTRSRAATP